MKTDLHDRLAALADDAPRSLDTAGLWQRGRRRDLIRRAGAVAFVAALLAALFAGVPLLRDVAAEREPQPVVPKRELHLPDHVYAPHVASEGTGKAGEIGPLAVLGDGIRSTDGDDDADAQALFGVSAVDRTVRFLDIPVGKDWSPGLFAAGTALSPDGTKVAFVRYEGDTDDLSDGPRLALGWGIYDTTSGEVTEIADPEARQILDVDTFEIEFTGDSRYLVTNYARPGRQGANVDELVLWDLRTGERIVAEGPGEYWLPALGSAPSGVVWSRMRDLYRLVPGRPVRHLSFPRDVISPSWGPDDRAFAYVGADLNLPPDHEPANSPPSGPWELYVGQTSSELHRVPLPADPDRILGWRDDRSVVVAYGHQKYAVVDVRNGTFERGSIKGEVNLFAAELADDLWANDLVPGVTPPEVRRFPTIGVVSVAVLMACLVLRWRRRRA